MFKVIFWGIFTVSILLFVGQLAIMGWAGITVANEVKNNDGDIAKTIGKTAGEVVKAFNEASK